MTFEPVIGLEIHIQLKTKTKMFCGCCAHETGALPNTNVCPICLGNPGVLPVVNEAAVRYGVLLGLALNCEIADHSKFDRKNYFYPDLPKAYQISQFDLPIAKNGFLEIDVPGGARQHIHIGITRAHLEEDAAKSFHASPPPSQGGVGGVASSTLVDFNRGGTPLVEIVTEPDFGSPREAKLFLQELRLIARYLGVSDADMEKGHLRCDANVSMREFDKDGNLVGLRFNPKTEIKNLNSFRHVEKALEYEINRQTRLWEAGKPPLESTTRGWNDAKCRTEEQRSKEDSADYRYFPEPDIPPLALKQIADEMRTKLPELPASRRVRFQEEYGFKPADARALCDDPALADFTEKTFSELDSWMRALQETDGLDENGFDLERKKLARLVSGWMLTKLAGLLADNSIDVRTMKISPENFAEFITLIATRKLNNSTGLKVLDMMLKNGDDPTHIMEDGKLGQVDDEGELSEIISRVVEEYPAEVARYRAGEEQLLKFLIGMVMKASEGTADPILAKNLLLVKLASSDKL